MLLYIYPAKVRKRTLRFWNSLLAKRNSIANEEVDETAEAAKVIAHDLEVVHSLQDNLRLEVAGLRTLLLARHGAGNASPELLLAIADLDEAAEDGVMEELSASDYLDYIEETLAQAHSKICQVINT